MLSSKDGLDHKVDCKWLRDQRVGWLGFGWLWECWSRLEDHILLGVGNQKGEAVDLLHLAGFEEFGHVGVD